MACSAYPTARRTAVPGVLLFVATTFASAFLIFLVQPLVAKRILPWFGGVPAVWSLCLAFYQTTLFAGYAYAYLLIGRVKPRGQLLLHAGVVTAAVLALPVLPGDAWRPEGSGDPSTQILAMLLANVALPFFVLAATGPLVAVWFSRRYPARSPYPLYAVSNLGSLVALLAYPFALEPRLPLSTTGRLWSGAFAVTGALVVACAALAWRARSEGAPALANRADLARQRAPALTALWVLLSACAVVLLIGVTNELCLEVASVPFVWIVPLAIYLASLVVCFGAPRVYRRIPFVLFAVIAYVAKEIPELPGGLRMINDAFGGVLQFDIARYGALLFATCMLLHGELYRLRPPADSLTAFYLCTAGGGALGGLAVGLVAPRALDDFYEFPIGLALAAVLLICAYRLDPTGWLSRTAPNRRFAAALAFAAVILAAEGFRSVSRSEHVLYQERNFFGVMRVKEIRGSQQSARILMHGTTMHGIQLQDQLDTPTAYFGLNTGVELALALREPDLPSEVGVIGLGAGTLAAYGREGDRFRFFEIDPAVIDLARDWTLFTFLARSRADVEVVQGDGRISLARARMHDAPLLDYLIVDAYSSDAVPIHLLTREALALYRDSLKPGGQLVFHVSSRYFDLVPMMFRLAADAGLHAMGIANKEFYISSLPATWVVMSSSEERIRALADLARERARARALDPDQVPLIWPTPEMIARAPLWTDDYSDLLGVLRPAGSALPPAEMRW
jgi:spermidine synthase